MLAQWAPAPEVTPFAPGMIMCALAAGLALLAAGALILAAWHLRNRGEPTRASHRIGQRAAQSGS